MENLYYIIPVIVGAYASGLSRQLFRQPDVKSAWFPPAEAAPYLMHFHAAEDALGLPRNLLTRVALAESNYDPEAVSHAGAQGLMQIVPRWHPYAQPYNPVHSIWYAGHYLNELRNQFGTWPLALAAYNWGPYNLRRAVAEAEGADPIALSPQETIDYVAAIAGDLELV